jgi:hypothetical protein
MPSFNPNAGQSTIGDSDSPGEDDSSVGLDFDDSNGNDCPPGQTRNILTGECEVDVRTPGLPSIPSVPGGPENPGEPPDDGGDITLEYGIIGCTDPSALNYEPEATRPCGQWAYVTDELGNFSESPNEGEEGLFLIEFINGTPNECCVLPGQEGDPGASDDSGIIVDSEGVTASKCQPEEQPGQALNGFIQTCVPNLDAFVPNWLTMDDGQTFFNKRTCEYSIVMHADPPECSQEYLNSFIPEAVERLLRFYNKEEIAEFSSGFRPSTEALTQGGLSREGLTFAGSAEVKTFYISPRPLEKTRVLIVVGAEEFNRIPEKEENYSSAPITGLSVVPSYVVFYGSEILDIFDKVSKSLRSYEPKYADWVLKTGKIIRGLNFSADANRIESFYKDLSLFIGESDLSYYKLETLEIGFDEAYQIQYVKVKEPYRPVVTLEKGFDVFVAKAKNTTALAYVSRLPDMYRDILSRSSASWYDLVSSYRFPQIEEVYVNDLTSPLVEGNEGIKALADASCPLDGGGYTQRKNAGEWALTQVNSIAEALLSQLRVEPCVLVDGKILEQRNRENLATQVIDLTLKEYLASDRIISDLPELIANGRWDSIEELYTGLMDNLGYCGLIGLIQSAVDCLLSALGYEDSIKIIISATVKAMDKEAFADFISKMPLPLQEIIVSAVNETAPQLLPFLQSLITVRVVDENDLEVQSVVDTTTAYSYTSAGRLPRPEALARPNQTRTFSGRMAQPRYAIPSTQDIKTLNEVVVDLITNDLLGIDQLLSVIETLPGAPIVISALEKLDKFCAAPPRFYPPLSDILQLPGFNVDICELQDGITLATKPRLQMPKLTIAGITDVVIENALVALKEIARRVLILVLRKILEIIFEELCKQRVGSDPTNLRSLMQAGCSGGIDEDVVGQALEDIANTLGCFADKDSIVRFVDNISSVVTECELVDLINGEASDSIYNLVTQIIAADPVTEPMLECLNDRDSIKDFFKAIGLFIDTNTLCNIGPLDLPFSQEVCDDLGLLDLFRDTRARALREKGVDGECIEQQLCLLRDKTIDDLRELTDMLNSGVFDNILPDFVQDIDNPSSEALLPAISPAETLSLQLAFDSMYESLTLSYTQDLIGSRGFLNMCLADSRGRGYNQHKSLERSILGPSVFNVYGSRGTRSYPPWNEWGIGANSPAPHNDWIQEPIQYSGGRFLTFPYLFNPLASIADEQGNYQFELSDQGDDQDNPDVVVTGRPPAVGGLPDKVGGYLQDQLRTLSPTFNKNSTYSTILQWEDYDESTGNREFNIEVSYDYNYSQSNSTYERDLCRIKVDTTINPPGVLTPLRESDIAFTTEDPIPEDILEYIGLIAGDRQGLQTPADVWGAFMEAKVRQSLIDTSLLGNEVYETFANNSYNAVSEGLLARLAEDIAKVDVFDYGYDFNSVPQIIYFHEDPGGEYEGNIAAAIGRYGGSEANPPFYIRQPEEFGFLKVANAIAPEIKNCEDGVAATRFPNFHELRDVASGLIGKIKDDERLSYAKGNILSIVEAPFDRALPASAVALNESLIYATCRTYISEVLLKGLPVFYFLVPKYPDHYSNILSEFVAQSLELGLQETGRGLRYLENAKDYYYLFMEQVVQTFMTKIDRNLVEDVSEEEFEALENISNYISANWQGHFFKKLDPVETREEKQKRWRDVFEGRDEFVLENARVILKRYIGEEISRMTSCSQLSCQRWASIQSLL